MPDTLIRNVLVRDAVELGENLTPLRVKVVTFMVDRQGPFTLRYTLDQFSVDRVNADMQKEIDTLRAIGALPPG